MKTRTIIQLLFAAAGASVLLAGCASEDTPSADVESNTPVTFTAAIQPPTQPAAALGTRATLDDDGNTTWTEGDDAAVCMLTSGGQFHDDVLPGALCKKYAIDPANGTLVPDDGLSLYYPVDGAVDFIAVSRYMDWGGNTTYKLVSMTNQSTVKSHLSADILYSNNAKNIRPGKDAVELRFRHLFSKLRFDITLGEGFTGGTVEQVTLNGMPDVASFAIQDGSILDYEAASAKQISPLRLTTPTEGAAATYTAIVAPHDGSKWSGRTIEIIVDGITYTGVIPDTDDYVPNSMHVYPVTAQNAIVTVGAATIRPWEELEPETGEVP